MGIFDRLFKHHNPPGGESPTPWDVECKARAAKFGYGQVPASEVWAAFEQVVVPSCSGFLQAKRGLLARQINSDMFHLVSFGAGKGGIYGFRWGVSLAYVPHEWEEACKYHRTLKAVRFDLFEDPWEFLIEDLHSAEGWQYMADTLHGPTCFREDLARAWANLSPVITTWFSTVPDLPGVVSCANRHLRHNWRGFRHHPDPNLILAFTLARLGKREEALTALSELGRADSVGYGSEILKSALDKTLAIQ